MPTVTNPIPANVAYRELLFAAAHEHHVDPLLLAAVAAQETGGPGCDSGRNIIGDAGHGHGVMQIDDRDPEHARWLRTHHDGLRPSENIDKGAEILRNRLATYGNVRDAVHAYNAGDPHHRSTVTPWADGTLDYASSVLRHYAALHHAAATAAR